MCLSCNSQILHCLLCSPIISLDPLTCVCSCLDTYWSQRVSNHIALYLLLCFLDLSTIYKDSIPVISQYHLLSASYLAVNKSLNWTMLSWVLLLQKTRPLKNNSTRTLNPFQKLVGLNEQWVSPHPHHHPPLLLHLLQSSDQSSALLWLGGGLQWILLAMIVGPGDAAASAYHRMGKNHFHNLIVDQVSASIGPNHLGSSRTSYSVPGEFCEHLLWGFWLTSWIYSISPLSRKNFNLWLCSEV